MVDSSNNNHDDLSGNHPITTQEHQYEEKVVDEEIQGAKKNDSDIEAAGVKKKVDGGEMKGKVKATPSGRGAVVYLLSSDEDEWPDTQEN